MKKILLIAVIFLPSLCRAQTSEDLQAFVPLFTAKNEDVKWTAQLKDSRNELNFVFSAAFVVYKEIFSSQDIDACVFTPSCSVYAIESIKEKGVVGGFLNAVDRLTRCNPGFKKGMPIDPSTGKYFDPVEGPGMSQHVHRHSKSHSSESIN